MEAEIFNLYEVVREGTIIAVSDRIFFRLSRFFNRGSVSAGSPIPIETEQKSETIFALFASETRFFLMVDGTIGEHFVEEASIIRVKNIFHRVLFENRSLLREPLVDIALVNFQRFAT